jgi:hypothetical protein
MNTSPFGDASNPKRGMARAIVSPNYKKNKNKNLGYNFFF